MGSDFKVPSRSLSKEIFSRSAVCFIPFENLITLSRNSSFATSYFAGLFTAPSIEIIFFLDSTKTTSPDLNLLFRL